MLDLIRNKRKNEIQKLAEQTAKQIGSYFEYTNNEELTLCYYLFAKEFIDQFDYELSIVLGKKRSGIGF